jgi:uncharacterized protein
MRFWDSSAVVPLLVEQDASAAVGRALQVDALSAWWGTRVECASAIARLEREKMLSSQRADVARSRLEAPARSWHEVQPSEPVRRAAQRLLRPHTFSALDALQAAAALVLAEHDPSTLSVVCLDTRPAEALRREGFIVQVPA